MSNVNVKDLILVKATPEQRLIALDQRYSETPRLNKENYYQLSSLLDACDFVKEKEYWVLVNPRDPSEIVAHAAVIPRRVIMSPKTPGDVVERGACSITHVFTNPDRRRQGIATYMMKLIHTMLAGKDLALSFLHSGVGEHFYSRCGWKTHTSKETVWAVEEAYESQLSFTLSTPLTSNPIHEDDLLVIAHMDAESLKAELPCGYFAVLPTGQEYNWLITRSKFYAALMEKPPPFVWGAQLGTQTMELVHIASDIASSRPWAFITWMYDFMKDELRVLRLRCHDAVQFRTLLWSAVLAGKEQGLKSVVAWNVDKCFLDERNGEGILDRKNSISAVATFQGPSLKWLANERYAWS